MTQERGCTPRPARTYPYRVDDRPTDESVAPLAEEAPEPVPPGHRPRTAIAVGLGAVILVLSLLVGVVAFGLSRTNHGHGARTGGTPGAAARQPDADGCRWWSANPATKADQRDVGAPPPSRARRIGTRTMTITTNRGTIVIQLNASATPCTVASFTHLATRHFYDNTRCHRLVTGGLYLLQCGDPSGTGQGGPSYVFANETAHTPPLPRASGPGDYLTYPRGTVA